MKKPLIGLTPSHNTDSREQFLRLAYTAAVSAAGAIPVILPLEASGKTAGSSPSPSTVFCLPAARICIRSSTVKRPIPSAGTSPRSGTPWRPPLLPRIMELKKTGAGHLPRPSDHQCGSGRHPVPGHSQPGCPGRSHRPPAAVSLRFPRRIGFTCCRTPGLWRSARRR